LSIVSAPDIRTSPTALAHLQNGDIRLQAASLLPRTRSAWEALRVTDGSKPPGPPRFAWAVAFVCFGAALLLIAILLYASHPEWF
jgi:hypothetical protein